MINIKLNKCYCLLGALFYFIYAYRTYIYEGVQLLDLLNLVVNFGIVLLISIWLISKSEVKNVLNLVILFVFVIYLFVLHSFVAYIDISYYITQEYVGNLYVNIERINFIPFKTIYSNLFGKVVAPVTIIQTVGNLFLLLPLAFALLFLQIINNKYKAVIVIFLTTVFIEMYQLLDNLITSGFKYSGGGQRAIDIDDVLLNTIGGLVGIALYFIYKKLFLGKALDKKNFTTQI
ncbi:VanZ family protein [Neobacillus sp. SuZ13]|uniref:VanZ family protein n=1 Tax=Neobacillus sp. SuZ13 TaxID=3047875 RepID=UPI0024BF21BF|nr:VanZ family protein [Neobacillus sp. SuZ13]WHY69604.1 VanZ family protein [Neobacillus sp. SuZ13]